MAERVRTTDLQAWARRKSRAFQAMGGTIARAVKDGIPVLLAEGLKHAPRHTGALRRSLRVYSRESGGAVELALHSDDPAAGMQESGGILMARRHPMTVPIGSERAYWDASGTRREPRQIAGLFRIRARNGREYLATRTGRQLVLRFALRHAVRQEGQGWATAAVRAATPQLDPRIRARVVHDLLATDRVAAP